MRPIALVLLGLTTACASSPRRPDHVVPHSALAPATDPHANRESSALLDQALAGDWTGALEYRDYSEPPTSTARVKLATWLRITVEGSSLREHFVYDDGPTKVVEEDAIVAFDLAQATYRSSAGKEETTDRVTKDEVVKGARVIVVSGTTIDNDRPAESRITFALRRSLLSIVEEVRPRGSGEDFAFRHAYSFTRAVAPPVTAKQ